LNALAKRLHQLFGELKQGKTPSHALKEPERAVANQELQDVPEPPAHEIEIATNVGTASVSLLQMVAEPEKSRAKPVTDRSKTAPKTPSVQPRRVPLAPQSAESGKGRRNQLAEHPRLLRRLWSWVSGGSAPIAPSNIARIRQRPGGPSRNPFQEGNILPPLKPPEPFGIGHGFSGPSTSPFQHPGIIPSRPKPPEPVGIGHGFSGPSTSPFQHPGIIPSRPKPPEPFGIRHGLAGDQRTDFFRRGEPVGPMRGQREEPWGRSRPLQTSGSGWNPDRFGFGASNQPVNLGRFILDAKIKLFDATRAGDRLGW
jgi:hypothetical protein